jgi:uncharacterized MAPEG superfamily protein
MNPLSIELRYLAYSALLGLAQIIAASHSASLQRGYRWTASARDAPVTPLTGVAGRLSRALSNFVETFPLFAVGALAVCLADRVSSLSAWGALLYFWARIAYVAVYAAGVPVVRSIVWNVAFAGIALQYIALLAG